MNLRVFYLTRRGISDGYVFTSRCSKFHKIKVGKEAPAPLKGAHI